MVSRAARARTLASLLLIVALCGSCARSGPNPKAKALNNQAIEYLKTGNTDASLRLLTQAIAIDPTYYLAYANRMNLYVSRGDYNSALSDATMLAAIKPQDPFGLLYRGLIEGHLGKADSATKSYKAVERLYAQGEKKVSSRSRIQYLLNYATVLKLLGDKSRFQIVINEISGHKNINGMNEQLVNILRSLNAEQLRETLLGHEKLGNTNVPVSPLR